MGDFKCYPFLAPTEKRTKNMQREVAGPPFDRHLCRFHGSLYFLTSSHYYTMTDEATWFPGDDNLGVSIFNPTFRFFPHVWNVTYLDECRTFSMLLIVQTAL